MNLNLCILFIILILNLEGVSCTKVLLKLIVLSFCHSSNHLNTIVWTLWSALLLWGGQLAHKLSTTIHGCYLLLNEQMICHFYLPEINLLRLSLWSLLPFFLYMKFSMTLCSTSFIYSLPAQLLLIVPFIALHKSFTCLFFCHAVSLFYAHLFIFSTELVIYSLPV